MNYAVIQTGGKQYIVRPNEKLTTDKLAGNAGDKVAFSEVLLFVNGEDAKVGTPFVKGVEVAGKILEQKKGDKVRVGKYKSKSRYRKVKGFRAQITEVMVESIKEVKEKKGGLRPDAVPEDSVRKEGSAWGDK